MVLLLLFYFNVPIALRSVLIYSIEPQAEYNLWPQKESEIIDAKSTIIILLASIIYSVASNGDWINSAYSWKVGVFLKLTRTLVGAMNHPRWVPTSCQSLTFSKVDYVQPPPIGSLTKLTKEPILEIFQCSRHTNHFYHQCHRTSKTRLGPSNPEGTPNLIDNLTYSSVENRIKKINNILW